MSFKLFITLSFLKLISVKKCLLNLWKIAVRFVASKIAKKSMLVGLNFLKMKIIEISRVFNNLKSENFNNRWNDCVLTMDFGLNRQNETNQITGTQAEWFKQNKQ